jgi:hypothetical protein
MSKDLASTVTAGCVENQRKPAFDGPGVTDSSHVIERASLGFECDVLQIASMNSFVALCAG